jgi:signal transduction histidine kinase
MLHEFLTANRDAILAAAIEKNSGIRDDKPITAASERGMPAFYTHLISQMETSEEGGAAKKESTGGRMDSGSTYQHGRELSRLGYTISQVVHGYGVLCQAIMQTAHEKEAEISAREFKGFNKVLDIAIADAVTGFEESRVEKENLAETERLGFLAHELRNALSSAIVAHYMIKQGSVGTAGSTNAILERNLARMRDIIDRSLSEVRLHSEAKIFPKRLRVIEAVDEVEATATIEARNKGVSLSVDVPPHLEVVVDPHHFISALANLVQNAIKFSKSGDLVKIRAAAHKEKYVRVEVEDQCGGLPPGKIEELFKPFTQKNEDKSGLGLGLTISRRAIALNGGALSARDLPGKGCVFSITLPIKAPTTRRVKGVAGGRAGRARRA